jgi:hypothetical protein
MKYIKQVFGLFLLFGFFAIFSTSFAQSSGTNNSGFVLTGCIDRLLKITAYYTPEATQWVFFHGDYATEKKINWGNRNGASGKHVYNGMLAGPKKYPFTTTVSIPNHGFWAIYDRWSAIISSGDFDRIDIRAGAGLQGMVNALRRGTKSVTWTLCSGWLDNSTHGFDRSNYPLRDKASRQMIWTLDMEQWNSGLTVYYLNSFLEQLNYLKPLESAPKVRDEDILSDHKQFWITNNQKYQFSTGTKLALCAFQQDYLWLSGDNMYCGYYGTNSRRIIANLVKNWDLKIPLISNSATTQEIKKAKKKRILLFR